MSDPREVLESWKEIAAYLGRSVRAVQLWEKEENLPVHRHQHDKQGSVFAYREEIDRWREARSAPRPAVTPRVALPSKLAVVILASAVILTVFGALWKHGVMIRSIAVLPFTSTAGGDIEHVSDGLTELLIDELASLPRELRYATIASIAIVALSIFDLMGRELYATFMQLSLITVFVSIEYAALVALRFRRAA